MDGLMAFLGCCVVVGVISYGMGVDHGKYKAMQEGFDRGITVECLGKSDYYWDCKDDNS